MFPKLHTFFFLPTLIKVKIGFYTVVVGEKFVFYEAYEEVGVARSHFGSHCNTVDWFVVAVTKLTKNSWVWEPVQLDGVRFPSSVFW